jgi:hypothetical protein
LISDKFNFEDVNCEEKRSTTRTRRAHYAMEQIEHVNEKDLEIELTKAEEDLEKLLSIERNEVDLINENLKLKKVLRNAKIGMWRKFQDELENKKKQENELEEMKKQNGILPDYITKR